MNTFLTIIEHLASLVATLSSAANPEFAPIINLLAGGINNELASIVSGNAPTLASTVENVAPGALTLAAGLAAENNPTKAPAIAAAVGAVVSAIPTPAAP